MSPRHRTAALAAAVGLLAIVAILVLVQRDGADLPLDMTTAPVTTGTVARRVMSTGTLQPVKTVDVGAQVVEQGHGRTHSRTVSGSAPRASTTSRLSSAATSVTT